jgi:hypothetical protein
MDTKHPNSRIITVFRAGSILSRAQGAAIDDFFADSKQSIGSYYDSVNSQIVGSGLTFEEQKFLLPDLIDITPDDRDFRKKVTEYYADITTSVPHGTGLQLEIGLSSSNDKDVAPNNMPLNLMDYVRYRHISKHPWVAMSKEIADGDQTKTFYIFDKTMVQNKNTKKVKEQDAAMGLYLQAKNDTNIVDQLLTLLGIDTRTFSGKNKDADKVERLRELVLKDPEKFITLYKTEDLENRATIYAMVNTKVLKQIGQRYIETETDKLIGNSLDETLYYFKDEENSDHVVALKARMQEAMATAPVEEKHRRTITGK